jgi:hypothetical protein
MCPICNVLFEVKTERDEFTQLYPPMEVPKHFPYDNPNHVAPCEGSGRLGIVKDVDEK